MKKIVLSGEVGWDITPKDIIRQLDEAKGEDLEIHLASPGGSVFDGIEIFNAFRDYKRKYPEAQMLLTIKGLAASMASYIAMNPAFDLIAAEDNAVLMIHNVWGLAIGDYRDLNKTADIFEGLTDLLAQAYTKKTKKSQKAIRQLMDDETWYFGQELKDAGFVDEIIETEEKKDKSVALATAKLNFKSLSEKLQTKKVDIEKIAACIKQEQHPAADAGNNILQEESNMTLKEFLAQNPSAKIEYDNELNIQNNAGKETGKKEVQDRVNAAAPFLKSSSDYSDGVKDLAVEVILGSAGADALKAAIALFDKDAEKIKSDLAALEAKNQGDIKNQQQNQPNEFVARVNHLKAALGQEVK